MALGALFAIIMAAGQAYKMMVKGEAFDVLKVLRVLGIAIVMFMWYPKEEGQPCILGMLAYIPNCIGSYTHDLYEIEAAQVQDKFEQLMPKISERDDSLRVSMAEAEELAEKQLEFSKGSAGEETKEAEGEIIVDQEETGNSGSASNNSAITFVDENGNELDEEDNSGRKVEIDPATGYAIDPSTGILLDPQTGEPIEAVSNLE